MLKGDSKQIYPVSYVSCCYLNLSVKAGTFMVWFKSLTESMMKQ